MSQNINLFAPAFRKQRRAVTLNALAASLAVVGLALLAGRAYVQHEVAALAEEARSADALLKVQRRYVEKLQGEAESRGRSKELEAETARLESELKQARDAMAALQGGVIGTEEGFAEYLRAFARQATSGMWLTGLSIGGGGEIEIRGRALGPELMPGYIQRLNGEKVFAGRSFDRLEIGQPQPDAPKVTDQERGRPDKPEARGAVRAPRFLEFSLATAAAPKPEKAQ